MREVKLVTNRSGSICISRLENVNDAGEASLHNKADLSALRLEWISSFNDLKDAQMKIQVLDMLQPH